MIKDITSVPLNLNSADWITNSYRFTRIYEWLTGNGIEFKLFYVRPSVDEFPYIVLLPQVDATALKLKFNL